MIGKKEWFTTRKYTGWGLTPTCWQGWAYIAAIAAPMVVLQYLTIEDNIKTGLMMVWAIIFSIDVIDLMIKIKRDERDTIHEALAERNAMWFMIAALVTGLAYQAASGVIKQSINIDPVIMIALLGATVVKAITHWTLRNK
jgi:hypothetical protein